MMTRTMRMMMRTLMSRRGCWMPRNSLTWRGTMSQMMRTSQKMMRTMKKRSVSSDHRCVCVALLNSLSSRLQYLQARHLQQRL